MWYSRAIDREFANLVGEIYRGETQVFNVSVGVLVLVVLVLVLVGVVVFLRVGGSGGSGVYGDCGGVCNVDGGDNNSSMQYFYLLIHLFSYILLFFSFFRFSNCHATMEFSFLSIKYMFDSIEQRSLHM